MAIRKIIQYVFPIGYWADVLVMRPERVQRPYLVVSIECPSPLQPAGRWWCGELPHKGVGVSNNGGVMGFRSSLEDFPYLGHVQVIV
jgi:hypothetical protein